uniref:Uncharacterized protein n=1 Tax=Neolamprologus brichardi TaxID=32507 RepID=A0A3Q4I9A3_NEOBR
IYTSNRRLRVFFFLGSLTLTLLQIREEAHREERVDGKIKLILGERFGIWLLYCKLKEKDKSTNIPKPYIFLCKVC